MSQLKTRRQGKHLTTREVPRKKNMDLIFIHVDVSKSVTRMTKRGVDIKQTRVWSPLQKVFEGHEK